MVNILSFGAHTEENAPSRQPSLEERKIEFYRHLMETIAKVQDQDFSSLNQSSPTLDGPTKNSTAPTIKVRRAVGIECLMFGLLGFLLSLLFIGVYFSIRHYPSTASLGERRWTSSYFPQQFSLESLPPPYTESSLDGP